jgi:O-antigen chain-terminating methyltransferase
MIYGSYLVVETVNPLSLYSFVNFYMDMTHKRPIHPETLKFLLEASGLREVETSFVSPVPDGMKLRKLVAPGDEHNAMAEIHNYNIDKLNNILFGPQDYFAFGKK